MSVNNIESFFKKKTFISHLWPNLMTSSYGWWPLWLHHKIEQGTCHTVALPIYIKNVS
jgi:hypothetical protein